VECGEAELVVVSLYEFILVLRNRM